MATADHIGRGRLGVNIVCGWNEEEFQMFGVSQQAHDKRYEQGEEWWSIVKRIWVDGFVVPVCFLATVTVCLIVFVCTLCVALDEEVFG